MFLFILNFTVWEGEGGRKGEMIKFTCKGINTLSCYCFCDVNVNYGYLLVCLVLCRIFSCN